MLLTKHGKQNYDLLIKEIQHYWENNVEIISEKRVDIPVDAFELLLCLYEKHKVLLEYETSTFALKLWRNENFVYLDKLTDKIVVYGFESMLSENIIHNFEVLDEVLKCGLSQQE